MTVWYGAGLATARSPQARSQARIPPWLLCTNANSANPPASVNEYQRKAGE